MSAPLTLLFMGTPDFAAPCLEALLASRHRVAAVWTQPPRPAHRGKKETPSPIQLLAEKRGLPVHAPLSLKTPAAHDLFAAYQADAAVLVAYGLLLPRPILDAPRLGCLNVHPSALPRWRGAAPIQRSIMAGDTETACAIMRMDEGLDTGPILRMERFPLPDAMDAGALAVRMAEMAGPLVLEALAGLDAGTLVPVPQAAEGATYAPKIAKEECHIDWSQPGRIIMRRIMGLAPHPGAYFLYGGERVKALRAAFEPGETGQKPGTVVDDRLAVACAEGAARLLTLQRPGKTPQDADAFLRGFPIPAGERLD